MQINQILLTTDLSDHARGACRCAADFASQFHANLHLVNFARAIPSLIPSASRDILFDDSLEVALAEEIIRETICSVLTVPVGDDAD